MGLVIRDNRQMKALTGVSQAQFDFLLPFFTQVYGNAQQQRYEEGLAAGERSRKPGAGTKGKLPTMADKLLFVLYYYKTYPTFDVLGAQFDMVRSKANENLHKLSPILYDTLVHLDLMPYREMTSPEALRDALEGVDQLIIDATERACRRSQDDATQREHYSGKKKGTLQIPVDSVLAQSQLYARFRQTNCSLLLTSRERCQKKDHMLKNTVMSMPDKWIVFLGRTFSGHNHDYIMLKQELPPDLDWFRDLEVWVDLGYQGIQSDYEGEMIDIPHKKPRKSKKNPNPELTEEQRSENKALSQVRIFIEHAIGGMKRFNILVNRFRNRKENFEDDSVGICAGLWNLTLCY